MSTRTPHSLALVFTPLAALVACDDPGGSGNSGPRATGPAATSSDAHGATDATSGSTTTSAPDTSAGQPPGTTTVTCSADDPCEYWFCDCQGGPISVVNARTCTSGFCATAEATCPTACADFGGSWRGTAGGGPRPDTTPDPAPSCAADEYRCAGDRCVPDWYVCDGESDCPAGDDEIGCDGGGDDCADGGTDCDDGGCPDGTFPCGDGSDACFPMEGVCDGVVQCPSGIDEDGC